MSDSATVSFSRGRGGAGRLADSLFGALTAVAGSLVLIILAYMVLTTTNTALPIFTREGLSFVTGTTWRPTEGQFGLLPFIYGTLVTSAIALAVAVPLSLGVSLYLTEIAPRRVRGPLAYVVDLLAAVPSVVYGLWGVFVLLPLFLQPAADFLARYLGFIPIFAGPASGISYFGAGVVLAIMIVPIISALSREVFRAVPADDRYAAYALGATRWEMIWGAVLPRSRAGIVGAVMLGLGRALGETIAVALLIGSRAGIDSSILRPGYSMAAVIANQFQEATAEHVRALVGVGVVLFVITIIVNVAARLLVWRMVRH
jgi:phosphate transport system permease protein